MAVNSGTAPLAGNASLDPSGDIPSKTGPVELHFNVLAGSASTQMTTDGKTMIVKQDRGDQSTGNINPRFGITLVPIVRVG
jgi:hypothetical protein